MKTIPNDKINELSLAKNLVNEVGAEKFYFLNNSIVLVPRLGLSVRSSDPPYFSPLVSPVQIFFTLPNSEGCCNIGVRFQPFPLQK